MKRQLHKSLAAFILAACSMQLSASTVTNDVIAEMKIEMASPKVAADAEMTEKIVKFLTPIYVRSDDSPQVYEEEWINENCTPECIEALKEDFWFEGDGYATWFIEGDNPGEDESEKTLMKPITIVKHAGKKMAKVVLCTKHDGKYVRTIFIECKVIDGKVKINSYMWK